MIYSRSSVALGLTALVGASAQASSHEEPFWMGTPRQVLFAQETCYDDNARGADGTCYPAGGNGTIWESGFMNATTFTMKYYSDAACVNEVESKDFPLSARGCSDSGPVYYTEEYHSYSVMIPYEDAACTTFNTDVGVIYWPEGRCNYEIDSDSPSFVTQHRYSIWNEHNGTIERWMTPVSDFNETMACSGPPDSVKEIMPGHKVTSNITGFFPCYTWVRFPEYDEGYDGCVDLGGLITANRRGRSRWAGDKSIDVCQTPTKLGRMRLDSIILSPEEDMIVGRVNFEQRGRIRRDDAHLTLVLGPSSNFSDPSSYVWKQKLFEDSEMVHYFSPLPDTDRVEPQQHSLGFKLEYFNLTRSDGTNFNFDHNLDYNLYVAYEVENRDGSGVFMNDCVEAARVRFWNSTTLF